MDECEFCGRKFIEGKIKLHQKSCTKEHPNKKVGTQNKQTPDFSKSW
jgi:hypothetical protein